MKKLSLFVTALGGALGGYILSNDKLRKELSTAKNAESAAKTLGKHLAEDGNKLAGEVKKFVESDEVQKKIGQAKKYAKDTWKDASKEMEKLVKKGKKEATGFMKKMKKSVKKEAKA